MTTDRLLQLLDIMADRHPEPTDDAMRYFFKGWNGALEALAKQVRLDDALMDRSARLADLADVEPWTPSIDADWGRS